ncbi:peroxiredoxin [Nitrosospira sp. Nsp5]|uniref:Peroxiredoxin n=1 Tax=Nitrosospira multiformis TaxID=1231 RepID=A0ABY0T6C3_9PROT|nr:MULTISPECIES: TlpA disulfide reductase family protein [Nitrosospira]PTR05074.1 peroxiredoxin [Nitrosospira sp. Nsp5]SDQ32345.1 Peroxiredoxin [Nitrosospira multiformis]
MAETVNIISASAAPELQTSGWLNTTRPPTLASLRGKVVVLHTFQIFCPGCVQVGIPQAQRISQEFDSNRVAVIGLHTVFEHHAVMGRDALEVFVHEYRLRFPIGIDKYDGELDGEPKGVPLTMRAYQMQGTPTLILIDKSGRIRLHKFGHVSDLSVGFSIGALLSEEIEVDESAASPAATGTDSGNTVCDENGCSV